MPRFNMTRVSQIAAAAMAHVIICGGSAGSVKATTTMIYYELVIELCGYWLVKFKRCVANYY